MTGIHIYAILERYHFWFETYGLGYFFSKLGRTSKSRSRGKMIVPCERSCQKEYAFKIWKLYHFLFESKGQGYSFSKVGQTSRFRSKGKKLWYHLKGLVTKNTHMQYESSIAFGLKYIAKVKVFVHATDTDAGADGRAIRWAPWTYLSRLAKKVLKVNVGSSGHMNINVEPRAYKINVGPFWRAMTSQASRFVLSPTCPKPICP